LYIRIVEFGTKVRFILISVIRRNIRKCIEVTGAERFVTMLISVVAFMKLRAEVIHWMEAWCWLLIASLRSCVCVVPTLCSSCSLSYIISCQI